MLYRIQLFILLVVCFMAWSYAQVPNGGFEQWTNGEPDGWFTNNLSIINLVTVTQSSDAHSGASSLRGEAINNNNVVYYSLVVSGKIGDSGFPISQNYSTLSGYYKLSSVQGDKLIVTVTLLSKGSGIAGWAKEFPAATGYTNFSLPIVYTQAAAADTCLITFTLGDTSGTVHAGSVFYIDDISLSGTATSVKEPTTITSFKLKQNYPNPFNPTTVINYEIPVSENVTMTIYNSLGQHIKTLVDEHRNAGHYQVTWNGRDKNNTAAPSGIYFYRIQAGSFIQSKKMILLK